jgi:hypothetical protein
MIRTIRPTLADIRETEPLVAVDDEGRRPSDIESREPEMVIHIVALDHRSIRIDEDRQREAAGTVIIGHGRAALGDDHQDFGAKGLVRREMGLQLLQLLAAVRSPGAANEHHHRRFGA